MTLPKDGFPRITSHAVKLIQQGLKGNFKGWEFISYCNHPLQIPTSECQNCHIMASEDWGGKPQFIVQVWFGPKCPLLHGVNMCPDIEFSSIDLNDYYEPQCNHITLKNDDWFANVLIAVDDRDVGKGNVSYDEDESEDMTEEVQEIVIKTTRSNQTGLEAFL